MSTENQSKTVIGIDPGFGFTKMAGPETRGGSGFRSIIGTLQGERSQQYFAQPDQLDIYDPSSRRWYVFGDYAERMLGTDGVQYPTGSERVTSKNYRLFYYAALSRALKPGEHDNVWIVTGLPVKDINKAGYADAVAEMLRGDHHFISNAGDYQISINEVYILPQPMGSFFHYVLNPDASGVAEDRKELMNQENVFIDVGTLTTDITTLRRNFAIPPNASGSIDAGVRVLYDRIRKTVFGSWTTPFPMAELDNVIKSKKWTDPATGKDINVSSAIEDARDFMWQQISELLLETVQDARTVNNFFVTGGGAGLILDRMRSDFGSNRVIKPFRHPALANVLGFEAYGRWQANME